MTTLDARPSTPKLSVFPAHPSLIPEDVAATLDAVLARVREDDTRLEASVLSALRAQRLAATVPDLVNVITTQHPRLSHRSVLRILECKLGLSYSHLEKLVARRKVATCSK
jgi:hypothetical protein